jgi:hypothetical protein
MERVPTSLCSAHLVNNVEEQATEETFIESGAQTPRAVGREYSGRDKSGECRRLRLPLPILIIAK